MGVPVEFRAASYHFELPAASIAQHPAPTRHQARLLTLDRAGGAVTLGHVPDLLPQLGPGDCLVRNVARVDRARLRGVKVPSGGRVEALLLDPLAPTRWRAMVRPSKKLAPGAPVRFGSVEARLGARLEGGLREVVFASAADLARAREQAGEVPLPPYIAPEGQDMGRYQTTYARVGGSVAAPTAGLHFEAADFEAWRARGVEVVDVSLDVGAGTFAPLRTSDVRDHRMHAERFRLEPQAAALLARCRAEGRRVVALGTTAMRVLESLPDHPGWEAGLEAATDLYVLPGYRFRMTQALVTNFHLPGSTLLLLVSAFAGREAVLEAYARARDEGLRFFSFGDCCWIR